MTRVAAEDGVAIAMAMMAVLLISALGTALVLLSSSETIIAAHFRSSVEAHYAADAVMARAIDLVAGLDDWAAPIAGATQSSLVDGAPIGSRRLPDGSTVDLVQCMNLANCQKPTACSSSDLAAVTADRPWGTNNPAWQLYAYGPLSAVLAEPSSLDSPHYVLLFVADDPAGTHRPPTDGEPPTREGIALRAEAFGPRGAHAIIEVVASRSVNPAGDQKDYNLGVGPLPMKILSWREVR